MEAMKMEMTLSAPFNGIVTGLTAKVGERVAEGVLLLRLEREGITWPDAILRNWTIGEGLPP